MLSAVVRLVEDSEEARAKFITDIDLAIYPRSGMQILILFRSRDWEPGNRTGMHDAAITVHSDP